MNFTNSVRRERAVCRSHVRCWRWVGYVRRGPRHIGRDFSNHKSFLFALRNPNISPSRCNSGFDGIALRQR